MSLPCLIPEGPSLCYPGITLVEVTLRLLLQLNEGKQKLTIVK